MAQYKAFEENIKAGGNQLSVTALSGISSQERAEILSKYNLNTESGVWNNLQDLLNALKDVSILLGEDNFHQVGKSVVDNAPFPPMNGLENALKSIDIAYHMNHMKKDQVMYNTNTGEMTEGIGHYKLIEFDERTKKATMNCHTPYPSKFEEGLIHQIVRKFKPDDSINSTVTLDKTKESRLNGADTCTFNISW